MFVQFIDETEKKPSFYKLRITPNGRNTNFIILFY